MEAKKEETDGSAAASASAETSSSGSSLSLTTLDKIKRFFFSKEEWEAYLVQRLEEQRNKQDSDATPLPPLEGVAPDSQHVMQWIRTVLPKQEEANRFLSSQLQQLQSERETTNK